jgi:hypothetical protein
MAKAANSISNFLAQVSSQGMAKPNRFEVTIQNAPCVTNGTWGRQVSMFCDSTSLPIRQLISARQQIFGPPEFFPVGIDLGGENFGMQFYVDRNMVIKKYFDAWMNGIVDPTTFTTNYRNNYLTTIYISQLDEADNVNYTIRIKDAFPASVAPISLDHQLSNTVERLNVSFHFRSWDAVSVSQGTLSQNIQTGPINNLNVSRGIVSYLTDISDTVANAFDGLNGQSQNNGGGFSFDPNFLIK